MMDDCGATRAQHVQDAKARGKSAGVDETSGVDRSIAAGLERHRGQFKRMMLPAARFNSCASLEVAGRISEME